MVFTWNMGHAAPSGEEINEWLPLGGEGIDLLIVASQECSYYADEHVELHDSMHGSRPDLTEQVSALDRVAGLAPSSENFQRGSEIELYEPSVCHDDDSDREVDLPVADDPPVKKKKKGLVRKLVKRSHASSSVGKSDWTTFFTCGKNLLGSREKYEHWERMVLQRLKRLEKLMTPAAANGERATSPSAVVLPLRAPPVLHTRTFAVQLPPMALDVPPQPPVAQPTAAGQTLVGNAALEASGLAGGIHRPFSAESPSSIRPPANREMRMRRRSDPGAE